MEAVYYCNGPLVLPLSRFGCQARVPQHLTYSEGTIFPDHRSRDQLDEDVCAAYLRWKSRYLETAGEEADGQPRFRVKLGISGSERTVSEGHG